MVEKRQPFRYSLKVPVVFSWTDDRGQQRREGGFTSDISTAGAYIAAVEVPNVGSMLTLEVLLAPSDGAISPRARLVATVKVKRCRSVDGDRGFAVAGELDHISRATRGSRTVAKKPATIAETFPM
ncbi:MAG: hypothetical protein NVS1B11_37530 [Terriglobales bacterium]